jgi:hypothetical protein
MKALQDGAGQTLRSKALLWPEKLITEGLQLLIKPDGFIGGAIAVVL